MSIKRLFLSRRQQYNLTYITFYEYFDRLTSTIMRTFLYDQTEKKKSLDQAAVPKIWPLNLRPGVDSEKNHEPLHINNIKHGSDRIPESRFVPDFSRVPLRSNTGEIQTKLAAGIPGDIYEREADSVAESVLSDREPGIPQSTNLNLQAKRPTENSSLESGAGPAVNEVLRSSSQPLNSSTREFMESRMGYDFSGVRVHADDKAAKSASELDALAYTVGRDVVFGAGQYQPETKAGQKLLAHELTHVIQQQSGSPLLQRQEKKGDKSKKKKDDKPAPVKLKINGIIAAGAPLAEETIKLVNEAADKTPTQWRRYVAYETTVKVGGSLAWRANNPGNLRGASTEIAKVKGAVGSFAVFADMEAGRAAQKALYVDKYGTQKVRDAVNKLTPPSENDTEKYLKALEKAGVKLDETVKSQIDLLMTAIEANEGMIVGIEVPRPAAAKEEPEKVPLMIIPTVPEVRDNTKVGN